MKQSSCFSTSHINGSIKNNNGNDIEGFSYEIEGISLEEDSIKTSRVKWHPDLVLCKDIFNPEGSNQKNGAQAFLEELLQNGSMSSTEIWEHAEGAGYGKASIQRAKAALGIKAKKNGMKEGWAWYLPSPQQSLSEYAEGNEESLL